MSDSPFKKPTSTGGEFFSPKNHVGDLAIILEPKKVLKDQPFDDNGTPGTRDVAIADIACFRDHGDVEKGEPSVILKGAKITQSILVGDIEENGWVDEVALVVIRQPKRAYVYRSVEDEAAEAAAGEWYSRRNEEIEKNLDEVPEF